MDKIDYFIKKIEKFIGIILITAIFLFVLVNIILRYVFNIGIQWSEVSINYMFIYLGFFSSAYILGFDYINNGFKELDLKGTVLRRKMMDFSRRKQGIDNYTTAYDIGSLLTKIYYKRILDKRLCGYAASLLKNQKINDRIPYFLPEEVEVAHKTGFEKGVVHDAGIIFSPQGQDYILCVLTAKGRGYNEAKKLIAQVSLLTYNLIK